LTYRQKEGLGLMVAAGLLAGIAFYLFNIGFIHYTLFLLMLAVILVLGAIRDFIIK